MNLDENKVSTGFRFKGKTISKIFNPRNQTVSNYIFFVEFQLKYTKKKIGKTFIYQNGSLNG